MALLDTRNLDGYGNQLRLYADETGTNVSGNYSSIHAYLVLHVVGSVSSYNINVGVSGATGQSLGYRSYGAGDHTLIDGYYNANHNSDGSGSTSVSGYFHGGIGNYDLSGTLTLTKINRYPILNSGQDFNDEENPIYNITSFGLYPVRVKIEAGGNTQLIMRDLPAETTGNYTFELTENERNTLRALATTNTLDVRETVCALSGTSEINASYKDYKMTIINANPTFSNFTFADTNSTTLALTGNSQYNINNYSNIKVTISTSNRAIALISATMSKYKFTIGNSSADINYSSSSSVNGTINNAPNGTYNVYAIDSRNNSTLVTKFATQEIAYEPIYLDKQNCSVQRNDNQVGQNAILTLSGAIWNNSFGQVTNSIKSVTYQFKKTDSSTWITGTTTITPTVSGNNFTFTGQIASNNQDTTWDLDDSYNIRVTVSDELSSASAEFILANGVPTLSLDKKGVGIMCAFDPSLGGSLQVDGKVIGLIKYSETEQMIGTWINGKPLYQKTIVVPNLPNSTSVSYQHNISNVDLIWANQSATFFIWPNGNSAITPYTGTMSAGSAIEIHSIGKTTFTIWSAYDRRTVSAYVTLCYTKTTD